MRLQARQALLWLAAMRHQVRFRFLLVAAAVAALLAACFMLADLEAALVTR
jgi:hypothetical protein